MRAHAALPQVKAVAVTLAPLARQFEAAHDALKRLRVQGQEELAARDRAVATLRSSMKGWLALLRGADLADDVDYQDSEIPDAILLAARDTLRMLARLPAAQANPDARVELTRLLTEAQTAVRRCNATRVDIQDQQTARRELAHRLRRELVVLRTVLRINLGPTHLDYRCLADRPRKKRTEAIEAGS